MILCREDDVQYKCSVVKNMLTHLKKVEFFFSQNSIILFYGQRRALELVTNKNQDTNCSYYSLLLKLILTDNSSKFICLSFFILPSTKHSADMIFPKIPLSSIKAIQ